MDVADIEDTERPLAVDPGHQKEGTMEQKLILALIAAMTLTMAGCDRNKPAPAAPAQKDSVKPAPAPASEPALPAPKDAPMKDVPAKGATTK